MYCWIDLNREHPDSNCLATSSNLASFIQEYELENGENVKIMFN